MSSSFKRGGKRRYSQRTGEEPTSNYVKHKIADTRKLQKLISTYCDNDSSSQEELRPFFLRSRDENSDDNLSAEEANSKTEKNKKSLSCKANTKTSTDKHEGNVKSSKGLCPNVMKEQSKSKESESDSISEGIIYVKHKEKREKKHLTSKANRKGLFNLSKDDADSSSGKEFQKSKLTRANLNAIKNLSHIQEENAISTDSNSVSISQVDDRTMISKKRSLQFKSRVVKMLNKFKEACSEYELKMEHVKWKHFKKELIYQESADIIIKKSRNVISNFRTSLDAQEKELTNFYKGWYTNSNHENTDTENSSSSEDEVLTQTENTEKSEKSRSSPIAASIVSECDSKEIFSDTSVVSNSIKESSPILGRSKDKRTLSKISEKRTLNESDSSVESKECQRPENECAINESADDIFDESTKENMDDDDDNAKQNKGGCQNENNFQEKELEESGADKGQQSPRTEEQNQETNNKDPDKNGEENVESTGSKSISSTEVSESNVTTDILHTSELETEEQIEKALLQSDSENLNEGSPIEKSSEKSMDSKLNEESKEISGKVKSIQKEGRGKSNSSSDEHDDLEASAKMALLESNSDDSMSPSDEKRKDSDDNVEDTLAKEKLLASSHSESSSSDSSIKSQNSKAKSSEKTNFQEFKRQTRSSKKKLAEADEKLKMQPEVVLGRLSNNVLQSYKNALDKSRQHLESKEIRSLIDLCKLQRDRNSAGESPADAQSKKRTKAAKEAKDTLLNHIMEGEVGEEFLKRTEEDCNTENNIPTVAAQSHIQTNDELMKAADAATKQLLLHSSDSDIGEQKDTSEDNDSKDENDKTPTKKVRTQKEKEDKDDDDDDDKEGQDIWMKNKWRRNKLLTMNFSSDENSEDAREEWDLKQKKSREQEENNTECTPSKDKTLKLKRRNRKQILNSDSDVQLLESDSESDNFAVLGGRNSDSDSSVGKRTKIRKRKTRKSSDTDSSVTERRAKPKRKRIATMDSDSDDSDSDQFNTSQGTPGKKGRKNIRKVMKDKQVADDTRLAAKEEEERLKRISDRQKLYNEMYEARLAGEEKVEKLVLDFDPEDKKELVTVHENLVRRLKPHQAKGIKFMWDACFESLERMKTSTGSGCIIAHCMGLGKTLQVITLVHTLLTHETTDIKTILIVCPLSTVLNWLNEFKFWLEDIDEDIELYEMTKMKKNIERKYHLESWQRTGGILIINYEMFRTLTGAGKNMRASMREKILKCLVDPGPDLVVCDEGHLLKNEDTALSKSMKRIKTLRRIVLTGTPLQNNLTEYHCMVQFVKPSLLGTKREFLNRFANPITNGQFDDSTEYDVKLMKKRAYVLHKMLNGCVQRFDYSVLTPFLPPKQEYVIFVSLTEQQINLYRYYLDNFARKTRTASGSLFPDFQALQRIWTHPMVLKLNAEKLEKLNERRIISSDSEGSLKDFVVADSDVECTSGTSSASTVDDDDDDDVKSVDSKSKPKSTKSNARNNKLEIEVVSKPEEPEKKDEQWWLQFVKPEDFEDIRASAKLLLLFGILRECEKIGDKVLVFSQSLYSLTLIERFLDKIDSQMQEGTSSDFIDKHTGGWSLGLDYFRLDGQTSAENRSIWCRVFNEPSNTRARLFLISTRAGGLGINLTAANRVIIFDASWNPSHDVQSIFRIYRFGQKKPCYVYRFLATGTMEEKIYNRQVTKLSLSCRVVDEQQIERHYSNHDLTELYTFEPNTSKEKPTLNLPKDRLLAELFLEYKDRVENYHEHDSLLENKAEEELNEEERKQAWLEYEEEKKGKPLLVAPHAVMAGIPNSLLVNHYNMPSTYNLSTDYEKLRELLQKDYPNATPETQQMMTTRALTEMYSYWERQAIIDAADHRPGQNAVVNQMQLGPQVPNLARVSYVAQNTNQNVSHQPNTYRVPDIRPTQADDDVVEIPSGTANNKTTNQEE